MHVGPSSSASLADHLREIVRARTEARIIARPRGTRFYEHLARSPASEPVPFDVFLKRQNQELRAAAKKQALCAPCNGRVIDVYG